MHADEDYVVRCDEWEPAQISMEGVFYADDTNEEDILDDDL